MNEPDTLNRFERASQGLEMVRTEVYILETWLNIHPFPKFKHGSKYINELNP